MAVLIRTWPTETYDMGAIEIDIHDRTVKDALLLVRGLTANVPTLVEMTFSILAPCLVFTERQTQECVDDQPMTGIADQWQRREWIRTLRQARRTSYHVHMLVLRVCKSAWSIRGHARDMTTGGYVNFQTAWVKVDDFFLEGELDRGETTDGD